jgi:hypothetical protein
MQYLKTRTQTRQEAGTMRHQNETTNKINDLADIQKMGEDSLSGLQRIDKKRDEVLRLWNEGLIAEFEAIEMVRR